jgi:hypothetical protein
VYTDGNLDVSTALVGTFDLALFIQATKGVSMGAFIVPMAGVVLLGGDGKILYKYVASSPGNILMILMLN